jgi:hypothetical protein
VAQTCKSVSTSAYSSGSSAGHLYDCSGQADALAALGS